MLHGGYADKGDAVAFAHYIFFLVMKNGWEWEKDVVRNGQPDARRKG